MAGIRRAGIRCAVEVFRNNEDQAIFSGDDDLLHFSSEVENALQKLLDEWGEERYLKCSSISAKADGR
jgi:hypothetical protein